MIRFMTSLNSKLILSTKVLMIFFLVFGPLINVVSSRPQVRTMEIVSGLSEVEAFIDSLGIDDVVMIDDDVLTIDFSDMRNLNQEQVRSIKLFIGEHRDMFSRTGKKVVGTYSLSISKSGDGYIVSITVTNPKDDSINLLDYNFKYIANVQSEFNDSLFFIDYVKNYIQMSNVENLLNIYRETIVIRV